MFIHQIYFALLSTEGIVVVSLIDWRKQNNIIPTFCWLHLIVMYSQYQGYGLYVTMRWNQQLVIEVQAVESCHLLPHSNRWCLQPPTHSQIVRIQNTVQKTTMYKSVSLHINNKHVKYFCFGTHLRLTCCNIAILCQHRVIVPTLNFIYTIIVLY